MLRYAVENLDPRTGRWVALPERFTTREEAQAKVQELSSAQPGRVFVLKLVPAA